jgi:hypothetical protein
MRTAFLIIVFAARCWSQASSGGLIGDLTGSSKQPPNISMTVQHGATGFSRSRVTDSHSGYRIDDLLPGDAVPAQHAGFRKVKGTDLGRFRRFNTPAQVEIGADLAPRPGPHESLVAFPELGTIFQREHLANSIYHSLQIKGGKRLSNHLAFLTSFVRAKSIDNADDVIQGQYESWGAQDERNLHLERGVSFFDVRYRFSTGFVYSIPILPGPGNEVVDGEVFNSLNHPNIAVPGPYPDFGPFYGKAFSAGNPRRMQFALRYDF